MSTETGELRLPAMWLSLLHVGTVEWLHVARSAGAPMSSVDEVRAVSGTGLLSDRYAMRTGYWSADQRVSRDITLIEAEVLEQLAHAHGRSLASGATRRNVTTRGVSLNRFVGQVFWIGEILCAGGPDCASRART